MRTKTLVEKLEKRMFKEEIEKEISLNIELCESMMEKTEKTDRELYSYEQGQRDALKCCLFAVRHMLDETTDEE